MKIYTESQLRNALKDAMLRGMRKPSKYESIVELMINDLNPIKLPSDGDIERYAFDNVESISFEEGAKWMRDLIQGDNKSIL